MFFPLCARENQNSERVSLARFFLFFSLEKRVNVQCQKIIRWPRVQPPFPGIKIIEGAICREGILVEGKKVAIATGEFQAQIA